MKDETNPPDLRKRLKGLALRIINLFSHLPRTPPGRVMGWQVLRSGTSVGAHYREGHRARSNAEFISKLETGLQELDETDYWLELIADSNTIKPELLQGLRQEVNELIAILVTCVKNAKDKGEGS